MCLFCGFVICSTLLNPYMTLCGFYCITTVEELNKSTDLGKVTGSFCISLKRLRGGYLSLYYIHCVHSPKSFLGLLLYDKKDHLAVWRRTVVWTGKNKNGLHSLPCYFLVNGLQYCPSAPIRVGEDKHRQ